MTYAALGQPAPTDGKILLDTSSVLQTERPFGAATVPSVSCGVVTLAGTVSSEGDKVLASVEIGRADGVKAVLNNLDVRNGHYDNRLQEEWGSDSLSRKLRSRALAPRRL